MHGDIQKAANRQQQLKKELEMKSLHLTSLDKRAIGGAMRTKLAKENMELADVTHYEANLLYNIMIVNLAYVSIDKFSE